MRHLLASLSLIIFCAIFQSKLLAQSRDATLSAWTYSVGTDEMSGIHTAMACIKSTDGEAELCIQHFGHSVNAYLETIDRESLFWCPIPSCTVHYKIGAAKQVALSASEVTGGRANMLAIRGGVLESVVNRGAALIAIEAPLYEAGSRVWHFESTPLRARWDK